MSVESGREGWLVASEQSSDGGVQCWSSVQVRWKGWKVRRCNETWNWRRFICRLLHQEFDLWPSCRPHKCDMPRSTWKKCSIQFVRSRKTDV
ncbi:hypothetical protein K443DRAFT_550591 [Laccaria amethystina LaAM-08-1]|uniref:Uncharacterized protein n=1 Tax=Laccaria amethystina LaAM-08-1 TaxID=1095629 RepID=A0A0C9X9R7_9AGAR|nr:hypothetical protein K443DRAFT_550591 [Laccaria amethystina LaAM-08-1]